MTSSKTETSTQVSSLKLTFVHAPDEPLCSTSLFLSKYKKCKTLAYEPSTNAIILKVQKRQIANNFKIFIQDQFKNKPKTNVRIL